jgi:hypothetical protein
MAVIVYNENASRIAKHLSDMTRRHERDRNAYKILVGRTKENIALNTWDNITTDVRKTKCYDADWIHLRDSRFSRR